MGGGGPSAKKTVQPMRSGDGCHPRLNADLGSSGYYLTPQMKEELSSCYFDDDGYDDFTADVDHFAGNKRVLQLLPDYSIKA